MCGQNGCNSGNRLLKLPDNTECHGALSTSVVAPSNVSVIMSVDDLLVSNSESITASSCETVTVQALGESMAHSELVFPSRLHCKSCDAWYNCSCRNTDPAVCNNFYGASVEFLCGKQGCNNGIMKLCLPHDIKSQTALSTSGNIVGNDSVVASLDELGCSVSNSELVSIKQSTGEAASVEMSVSANDPVVCSDASVDVCADITTNSFESVSADDLGHSVPLIASAVESFDNVKLQASSYAAANTYVEGDDVEPTPLSSECVDRIIGSPAPQSNIYEQQLQLYAEFDIPGEALSRLRVPNHRYLLPGCWQSVFIDGLKKSNSMCVFCFRYHSVCTSAMHRSNRVFYARGYCSVPECPVKFTLEMYVEVKVHVYYSGSIKHPLCGQWARPIRGLERNKLQQQFAHGRKPFSVYVEKLNMKTGSELLAGNYDSIGKSSHVLRKISSEGVHSKQLDPDVYQSLLKLQASVTDSVASRYGIKTFVQSVSIAPIILHLWTENGVRLYHQLACCNALFLDATGSVVRKIPNCKRILYYEMSVHNPTGSGCSIPVAAMLASDHTVSSISNFLQIFRDAEKRIFGFRSFVTPVVVKIDFSMALISSILMVYNRQDMHEYLQWSWETVHDGSTARRGQTVVHVCLAHFIKCVKLQCQKIFKGAIELVLYATSLISAAHNLSDVSELFHDLCVVLCSRCTNELFNMAFARLQFKISAYDPKHVVLDSMLESDSENDMMQVSDVRGCEDRVMSRCPTSPFLSWASAIYATVVDKIKLYDRAELSQNRFFHVALCEQLLKLYMPTLPLWSNVLVSVYLTVDNKSCSHNRNTNVSGILPRTSGTQEQRFYVLKHLVLGNKSTRRMDEFVQCVHELFTATEKEFVVTYLRKQRKRTSTAATLAVQENWAKKKKQIPSLLNPKLGKYQQPPTKKMIKDLNAVGSQSVTVDKYSAHVRKPAEYSMKSVVCAASKFSPMTNFGNTCWFNAAMQALYKSNVCAKIVEHYQSVVDVELDPSDRMQPLHASLCDIWCYMTLQAPNPVPRQMMLKSISLYNRLFDERRIGTRTQHDVHEFLTDCIFSLFCKHSVCPKFMQDVRCISCGELSSVQREETCPCLVLTVPDITVHDINVQQLIDEYFVGSDVSSICYSEVCNGTVQNTVVRNRFTCLPDSITILLQRYKQCNNTFVKNNVNVLVNRYVRLHCVDVNATASAEECTFNLCSVVSHVGSTPNHGHYAASVLQELEDGSLSFAICDDSNINVVSTRCIDGDIIESDFRTVSNAVLLMYNRYFFADIRLLPVLVGLQRTTGLASLVDAMRSTAVGTAQQHYRIVSDILSGKHSDTLLSEISRIARVDLTGIIACKLFISTLISNFARTMDLRCNTFFMHSSNVADGRQCSSGQSILFLESVDFIHQHTQLHFFPETILVICSESKPARQSLDLSSNICHVFPSQTLLYEFVGALTWQNSSVVFYDSLHSIDPSASILLYNMNKLMYCTMTIASNNSKINSQLDCVNLAPDSVSLDQVYHVERSYCNTVLSATHWHLIMSRQWFTDVIVDSYFTLLARHVCKKVLVYSCSFFNTLFFSQNPDKPKVSLCSKENSKAFWFNAAGSPLFDYVIIPGSLLNAHFVTVVVDLRTLCISMCDPMLSSHNKIVSQVARYTCQEYFLSTGTALNVEKLSMLNYCSWDCGFQEQRDTHNCGAYICLIVKCIVQNKLLRFQSPDLLRQTICHELIHNQLL